MYAGRVSSEKFVNRDIGAIFSSRYSIQLDIISEVMRIVNITSINGSRRMGKSVETAENIIFGFFKNRDLKNL